MSQVIIVSNRLPVSVKKENGKLEFYPSIGGLATGLASYVDDKSSIWIGWPGIASDDLTDRDKQTIAAELAEHNCSPIWLRQREIDDFYNGYSNRVLWPLFHRIGRQPKDTAARKRWWQTYRSVNEQFAEAVLNRSDSGSRIWVHDYQLLLVPGMLRSERQDVMIGFFLHIPFPTVNALSNFGEAKKLMTGMLGADVVGFHTQGYVENFATAVEEFELGLAAEGHLVLPDRLVRVGDFPMGIDYAKFASASKSKVVKTAVRAYYKRYRRCKVIVAVDRLDPSKGLLERLHAYKLLLETHPRYRGKVVFSMVAAPSRTDVPAYQQLSKKLAELVKQINAEYGTAKWQPIDYINQAVSFEEVTALFQIADVAFIAPLRDGMNLTAKEFVASNNHGVLILSETAGAADELSDALIVNPLDWESLVDALHQALTMRKRELRRRLKRMRLSLASNTVETWARDFIDNLQRPIAGTPQLRTWTLKGRWEKLLLADFRQADKRLLLLDYDGTLVPFTENYVDARPPEQLLKLIGQLGSDPRNELVLVSGRSAGDLEHWFGGLPISLVAEHGAAIKKAGNKQWQIIERSEARWQRAIKPILEKYADLTPKARVETKPHTLVWHYRGAPAYDAQKHAVIIKRVLKPLLRQYGLALYQGNKILEIKNPAVNKGVAVERWLAKRPAFVLAIGDDYTDEDLFQTLPDDSYTIKVGRGRTNAKYRLWSEKAALSILKKLARQV